MAARELKYDTPVVVSIHYADGDVVTLKGVTKFEERFDGTLDIDQDGTVTIIRPDYRFVQIDQDETDDE